jgi:hypothetical protein
MRFRPVHDFGTEPLQRYLAAACTFSARALAAPNLAAKGFSVPLCRLSGRLPAKLIR